MGRGGIGIISIISVVVSVVTIDKSMGVERRMGVQGRKVATHWSNTMIG